MAPRTYFCQYCHQIKPSQEAVNRHIKHSPECSKAWQTNLGILVSTRRINNSSDLVAPSNSTDIEMAESAEIFAFPEYQSSSPPEANAPHPRPRRQPVEMEDVDDVDDPCSQT